MVFISEETAVLSQTVNLKLIQESSDTFAVVPTNDERFTQTSKYTKKSEFELCVADFLIQKALRASEIKGLKLKKSSKEGASWVYLIEDAQNQKAFITWAIDTEILQTGLTVGYRYFEGAEPTWLLPLFEELVTVLANLRVQELAAKGMDDCFKNKEKLIEALTDLKQVLEDFNCYAPFMRPQVIALKTFSNSLSVWALSWMSQQGDTRVLLSKDNSYKAAEYDQIRTLKVFKKDQVIFDSSKNKNIHVFPKDRQASHLKNQVPNYISLLLDP